MKAFGKIFVVGLFALFIFAMFNSSGCAPDPQPKPRPYTTPVYNTPDDEAPTNHYSEVNFDEVPFVETSAQGGAGLGTYSVGYRMGQISKFSVKGLMNKTGEGQMLMGRESTPYVVTYSCGTKEQPATCKRMINPWKFSMQQEDSHLMQQFAGEYVWVQYNQAQFKSPLYDTDYLITQLGKIDRKTEFTGCFDPSAKDGNKSDGVRIGRIVKASQKGHMSKTGEIMMQVGNAGAQFKNMSVTDSMYKCAVTALKGATKVKVFYRESWFRNPFASDSTYAVYKIEPIQDI